MLSDIAFRFGETCVSAVSGDKAVSTSKPSKGLMSRVFQAPALIMEYIQKAQAQYRYEQAIKSLPASVLNDLQVNREDLVAKTTINHAHFSLYSLSSDFARFEHYHRR